MKLGFTRASGICIPNVFSHFNSNRICSSNKNVGKWTIGSTVF